MSRILLKMENPAFAILCLLLSGADLFVWSANHSTLQTSFVD